MPGMDVAGMAKQVGGQEFANAATANMLADGGANLLAGMNPKNNTLPQSLSPEQMELLNNASGITNAQPPSGI